MSQKQNKYKNDRKQSTIIQKILSFIHISIRDFLLLTTLNPQMIILKTWTLIVTKSFDNDFNVISIKRIHQNRNHNRWRSPVSKIVNLCYVSDLPLTNSCMLMVILINISRMTCQLNFTIQSNLGYLCDSLFYHAHHHPVLLFLSQPLSELIT